MKAQFNSFNVLLIFKIDYFKVFIKRIFHISKRFTKITANIPWEAKFGCKIGIIGQFPSIACKRGMKEIWRLFFVFGKQDESLDDLSPKLTAILGAVNYIFPQQRWHRLKTIFFEKARTNTLSQAKQASTKSERRNLVLKSGKRLCGLLARRKAVKDNKANSETFASSSEGRKNVYCLCVENNGHHKTNPKVRKVRSFNYLKRRKVRQFGDQLNSVAVVEEASVQDCGTATGTFHDFQSERRISRHERLATTSNNNLVSEMARGVNLPQCECKGKRQKRFIFTPA